MTDNVSKMLRSAVGAALLFSSLAVGQTDQDRAAISNAARARVQSDYSRLQPAWFEQFLQTGNCDHLGANHPDWSNCMVGIATWTNHKMNPQVFGPLNMHLSLIDGVATQVENVSINGSTASALVVVSGTCRFTDESSSCTNSVEMPKRAFRTKVRVTLNGSGLLSKQWQVVRSEEDPAAAQARKQALTAEIGRRVQAQQSAQNKFRATQELHFAIQKGDEAAAAKALEQGADPNMTVENAATKNYFSGALLHETALHLAVNFRNVAIVRMLLEHGANVNQRGGTTYGRSNVDFTPLRSAIQTNPPGVEIVKLLLLKGADPNLDSPINDAQSPDCQNHQGDDNRVQCQMIVDLLKGETGQPKGKTGKTGKTGENGGENGSA